MMKRMWPVLAILAACVLAGLATFQLIGCSESKPVKVTEKNKASVEKTKEETDSLNKALEVPRGWHYEEEQDKMGSGSTKLATIFSVNTVSFNPPYEGAQHGLLTLRSHPRHGKDVILSIERGQFLTGSDGCRVLVRFDDDKSISFRANEPADHSTTVLFIDGYSRFATRLLRSKKLMIEAPFYQEGNQILEFKVDSLVWPKPPPPPLSLNEQLKREYRATHPQ